MAITDIINEIDAYLARLREARNLLSTPATQARRQRAPRVVTTVNVRKRVPSAPGTRRVSRKKSRPNGAVPKEKIADKLNESIAKLRGPEVRPAVEPPVVMPTAPTPLRAIEKAPSYLPTKSTRRRTVRQTFTRKPAIAATALSGATSSKIVVVSAAEAQRERQRTAHAEAERPRVPATGLNARQAFEALFKNGTDASSKRLV
jgi:hypothetical protein